MGLAGTGLAALEDDYTRNSKYHGEDANTKHGCTGVRYLLVLAGVCITLVLVGIVALVGLGPCQDRLSPPWPGFVVLFSTRPAMASLIASVAACTSDWAA